MSILITGGAGYIGSHTTVELLNAGFDVVLADDFSNSSPAVLERLEKITGKKFPFYQGSILDTDFLDKVFTNNQVTIAGKVAGEFTYSHTVYGEDFYTVDIEVSRLSNSNDIIPVMVSERILDVRGDYRGYVLRANGQFRSYNRHEETRNRLVLSVFAREVEIVEPEEEEQDPNHIFLDGYVCKKPVYRKTPLGREIADVLLAVNRPYGKSDYIPCICWGRNARYADQFEVGAHVQIWGRIQSREYQKKISEEEYEKRVAYEVSVSKLEYQPNEEEM